MGLFDSAAFRITEQALDASWYQQNVISNNIANIDTPNFKAKTVSFKAMLDSAMHARMTGEDRFHISLIETYETNTNQILDGNNVDLEKESNALVDAQYQYSTMIDYLNSRYNLIRTAIGK